MKLKSNFDVGLRKTDQNVWSSFKSLKFEGFQFEVVQ